MNATIRSMIETRPHWLQRRINGRRCRSQANSIIAYGHKPEDPLAHVHHRGRSQRPLFGVNSVINSHPMHYGRQLAKEGSGVRRMVTWSVRKTVGPLAKNVCSHAPSEDRDGRRGP